MENNGPIYGFITAINHAKLYKKAERHNQKGSFYVNYTLNNINDENKESFLHPDCPGRTDDCRGL
jgi:hypothetical protein